MLVALFFAAVASVALAEELDFEKPSFSVSTGDDWSPAGDGFLEVFTHIGTQSARSHARRKGVTATPEMVDAAVLLMLCKHPLGSREDNPNVILAKEKKWAAETEETGLGYLKLMEERFKLTTTNKFIGEAKPLKIGNFQLYRRDAVNTVLPRFETKQRYICTFLDGYYVYFILSYNEENDADYMRMMEFVESFCPKCEANRKNSPLSMIPT